MMTLVPWWAQANQMGGDENPGAGLSTGNSTSVGALAADANVPAGGGVFAGLQGTAGGHPIAWWFAIFALLIVMKFSWEASGEKEDFRSIRIGFWSFAVITINAILGIALLKWVAATYKIPGFTDLMASA